MNIVQATLVQKGHHHTLSYCWWDSFRKGHHDLSLRKAEALSHPRYVCCTSDTINRYFDLLEEAMVYVIYHARFSIVTSLNFH